MLKYISYRIISRLAFTIARMSGLLYKGGRFGYIIIGAIISGFIYWMFWGRRKRR